jgi:hypothetical protein
VKILSASFDCQLQEFMVDIVDKTLISIVGLSIINSLLSDQKTVSAGGQHNVQADGKHRTPVGCVPG